MVGLLYISYWIGLLFKTMVNQIKLEWHQESSLDHPNLQERLEVYVSIIIINSSRILLCDSQGVCVEDIIIKLSSSLSHFYEYFTLLCHLDGLTQTPSKPFLKSFWVNECKNLAVNLQFHFWKTTYVRVDARVYLWWLSIDMFIVISLEEYLNHGQ